MTSESRMFEFFKQFYSMEDIPLSHISEWSHVEVMDVMKLVYEDFVRHTPLSEKQYQLLVSLTTLAVELGKRGGWKGGDVP